MSVKYFNAEYKNISESQYQEMLQEKDQPLNDSLSISYLSILGCTNLEPHQTNKIKTG